MSAIPLGSGCGFTSLDLFHNTDLEIYKGHEPSVSFQFVI